MKTIFLSYHYDAPNKELARHVEELVESHNLRAVTGDALGGNGLTDGIKAEIARADGLVALLTRAQPTIDGQWLTHPYCASELQYARSIGKPAIALLETGVTPQGLFQEHEYIAYDAAAPLPAFLKLSRTLWRWKFNAGRILTLQVIPEDTAQEIWDKQAECQWQYRLLSPLDESEWRAAKARKQPGGLYLYCQVPEDAPLIEVRIQCSTRLWTSDAMPFHLPVTLVGAGA
jgi:hypothetical protein